MVESAARPLLGGGAQSAHSVIDVFCGGIEGDICVAYMAMYTVQADLKVCLLSGLVRNIGPCRELVRY